MIRAVLRPPAGGRTVIAGGSSGFWWLSGAECYDQGAFAGGADRDAVHDRHGRVCRGGAGVVQGCLDSCFGGRLVEAGTRGGYEDLQSS